MFSDAEPGVEAVGVRVNGHWHSELKQLPYQAETGGTCPSRDWRVCGRYSRLEPKLTTLSLITFRHRVQCEVTTVSI